MPEEHAPGTHMHAGAGTGRERICRHRWRCAARSQRTSAELGLMTIALMPYPLNHSFSRPGKSACGMAAPLERSLARRGRPDGAALCLRLWGRAAGSPGDRTFDGVPASPARPAPMLTSYGRYVIIMLSFVSTLTLLSHGVSHRPPSEHGSGRQARLTADGSKYRHNVRDRAEPPVSPRLRRIDRTALLLSRRVVTLSPGFGHVYVASLLRD